MKTIEHRIPNGSGWELSLFQTWDEVTLDPSRRPVLIVPGYGMNSFIFSFHPNGLSLEGYLAKSSLEVWRVDLRGQGASRPLLNRIPGKRNGRWVTRDPDDFKLEDLALTDLRAAIDAVLSRTRTKADRVDVIGASLGGTIMFIHAVMTPECRIGSMVAVGSPVRWVKIHPVLRLAFSSPRLVGLVRLRGTRRMAELALPQLVRLTPSVLSVYMNAGITDTAAAREMVRTVEDPNRYVNRQIAHWIQHRDLVIRGSNISERLTEVTKPVMCVVANSDGIVPRETAEFPYSKVGSQVKRLLQVGTEDIAMAHADLFVSNEAQERVFFPIAEWLAEQI